MTETKPLRNLPYGPNGVTPENCVGSFNESKKLTDFLRTFEQILSINNPRSIPLETSPLELWTKRNMLDVLLNGIIEQESKLKGSRKGNVQNYYRIFDELKQRFQKSHNIIKTHEETIKVAEKKMRAELKFHRKLKKEIEKHQSEIQSLEGFLQKFEEESAKLKPYETVLEDVIQKNSTFRSVNDLIVRCDALSTFLPLPRELLLNCGICLVLAQEEVTNLQKTIQKETRSVEEMYANEVTEVPVMEFGLQNQFFNNEEIHHFAVNEANKWEGILANIRNMFVWYEFRNNSMIDALREMCRVLVKRPNAPHIDIHKASPVDMLEYITSEGRILEEVLKRCENINERYPG